MSTTLDTSVRLISILLLLTLIILLIVRFPRKGGPRSLPWNQSPPEQRQFNPPPGWPPVPPGWVPPPGWQPDPSWPPAPADWQFWR